MDVLDNGVHICELANTIQQKAEECVQQGQCNDVSHIENNQAGTQDFGICSKAALKAPMLTLIFGLSHPLCPFVSLLMR